jgi:putative NADH-flavin reductase
MAKRLLVFGATGATGKHVVRIGLERGLMVRAFVRTPSKLPDALRSNPNLEVVEGDVTDAAAIDRAVAGADFIVCTTGNAQASQQGLVMATFVRAVVASMRKHGVRRLLYQAGTFSHPPGRPSPPVVRMLRAIIGPLTAHSGMFRDNDEIMRFLTAEAQDLEWFVPRPGIIREQPSRGTLRVVERPGQTLTFADLAAFNVEHVQSGTPPRECPYLGY